VGQVPAHRQVHAENGVAWIKRGIVDGEVGLSAGVRLHVGVVGAEEGAHAVAGEVLDDVDLLAPAVVALAGEPLGVLVRENGASCLKHGHRDEVLRRDELDGAALACKLGVDRRGDLRVLHRDVLK
jgi:hypothetical protein